MDSKKIVCLDSKLEFLNVALEVNLRWLQGSDPTNFYRLKDDIQTQHIMR